MPVLLRACEDVLVPAAERFHPDLLLVSAGFDAVSEDPLGDAECTPDGFARVTRLLCGLAHKLCGGRLLFALEGGYNHSALASCMAAVAQNLLHGVDAIDIDTEEKFVRFVATCSGKLEQFEPLKASLSAIWDTRWGTSMRSLALAGWLYVVQLLGALQPLPTQAEVLALETSHRLLRLGRGKSGDKIGFDGEDKSCKLLQPKSQTVFVISLRSLRCVFGIFGTLVSQYLLLSLEK